MSFKDAQSFQNLEGILKFQTPVMWHEGSSALSTQQYWGTAAKNISPQVTYHQWLVQPCCCWKLFFSIIVCTLWFKYIEQQQSDGGQHHTKVFNSEVTELRWIFCSRVNIFT